MSENFDLTVTAQGEGWTHTAGVCRDPHCTCNGGWHEKFKGEYRGLIVRVTLHEGAKWSAWVEGFRPVFDISYSRMCEFVQWCADERRRMTG